MFTIKTKFVTNRLTLEERETHLDFDPITKQWTMYSCVPKHFNKALRQGWTPIEQGLYKDGTVADMTLVAAERAITIRTPKKREVSEEQRNVSFGRETSVITDKTQTGI